MLDPERVIQIGIRGGAEFLWEFSYESGMTVIHAEEVTGMGVPAIIEMVTYTRLDCAVASAGRIASIAARSCCAEPCRRVIAAPYSASVIVRDPPLDPARLVRRRRIDHPRSAQEHADLVGRNRQDRLVQRLRARVCCAITAEGIGAEGIDGPGELYHRSADVARQAPGEHGGDGQHVQARVAQGERDGQGVVVSRRRLGTGGADERERPLELRARQGRRRSRPHRRQKRQHDRRRHEQQIAKAFVE